MRISTSKVLNNKVRAVVPNRGASCNAQGCREMLQCCGSFFWLKLRPNSSSTDRNDKHCSACVKIVAYLSS